MNNQLKTFLISLLTPGIGYLHNGNKKSFYKTIIVFFMVILAGVTLKLVTSYRGLSIVLIALVAVYTFAAVHATLKVKAGSPKLKRLGLLKLFWTVTFLLVAGLSFANRRIIMGFDIMSMGVPVMEPTVLKTDRFLVDTWVYKNSSPKKGDIVAHSFNGQRGLYLNRIIAIEGDKIEIKNGVVFLNAQIAIEPYVLSINVTKPQSNLMKSLAIPKGHYFVMGDNRDGSFGDSRFSGTITIDNIVGKATETISSQQDKSRIGRPLK